MASTSPKCWSVCGLRPLHDSQVEGLGLPDEGLLLLDSRYLNANHARRAGPKTRDRQQRLFPRCAVPDEASTRYGKLLTRLTGPEKTREMAHNTGFSGMARPGSDGLGLPFGGENVGAAGSESPSVSSGQAFG